MAPGPSNGTAVGHRQPRPPPPILRDMAGRDLRRLGPGLVLDGEWMLLPSRQVGLQLKRSALYCPCRRCSVRSYCSATATTVLQWLPHTTRPTLPGADASRVEGGLHATSLAARSARPGACAGWS